MSISLQVADTQEAKHGLVWDHANRLDLLPPTYIISHRRSHNLRTLKAVPALWELATVVVSAEEELDYKLDLPGARLLTIPANYRGLPGGVGRARQFVLDTAEVLGQDRILILDDDLRRLTVLFATGDGKASRAVRSLMDDDDIPHFYAGVLNLTAQAAEEAFHVEPRAVLASPQCNNSDRTVRASQTRWRLNMGAPPGQLQVWAVDRYAAICGQMDLERYNWHGNDIGTLVQIIADGGDIVDLPTIVGDYLDYEVESVIRTPETAPVLRQENHDSLLSGPLAQYIKTRTDVLDRPQWHSLRWTALLRDGKVRHNQAYWVDPEPWGQDGLDLL